MRLTPRVEVAKLGKRVNVPLRVGRPDRIGDYRQMLPKTGEKGQATLFREHCFIRGDKTPRPRSQTFIAINELMNCLM
jgi:hypothetical protein